MGKSNGNIGVFRNKYIMLAHKYNRVVRRLKKNRIVYKRLLRNYSILKQRLTRTKRQADRDKRQFIKKSITEKYRLILDHRHRILYCADSFLEEIEMSLEELASSFYLDILFQKYLPNDFSAKEEIPIEPYHFPFMLQNYEYDGKADIHPFVHFRMEGKREYDAKKLSFLFYLEAKDISSDIELEYFQKTDELIRRISSTNVRLQKANKAIEVHKFMLISLVCSLIEEYNRETSEHLQNIRLLTSFLTEECLRLNLLHAPPYDINEYIKDINYTSVLHDIGKMGIPKEILEKKEKLTEEELCLIKEHPAAGAAYIKKMIDMFKKDPEFCAYDAFLQIPYEICLYHHERWDGSGYPEGRSGEAIPMSARIVALSDAYDAMRMQRSYNTQKTHKEAVATIVEESGKHFDPALVKAFLNIEPKFEELRY